MFLRKTIMRYGILEITMTNRVRSYRAAMKVVGSENKRDVEWWLNSRAENAHLPIRRQKRAVQGIRLSRSLQKFAAVHYRFSWERHFNRRDCFMENRTTALAKWRRLAGQFPISLEN